MKKICMLIFFLLWPASLVHASDKSLTIEWNGGKITYRSDGMENVDFREEGIKAAPGKPIVDCAFLDMRTKCYQMFRLKKSKDWRPYGVNLKFVEPIAILPGYFEPDPAISAETDLASESDSADWSEKAKRLSYILNLRNYEFTKYKEAEINNINEIKEILGPESQDLIFSRAESTVGGKYALDLWRSLVGSLPRRMCSESEDDCSVVLNAKTAKSSGIAYCSIKNTTGGIGIPFDCMLVAVEKSDSWYVISYNGPEQCDGCGAAARASCDISTKVAIEDVANVLSSAFKSGRTNIELKQTLRRPDYIKLEGKKKDVDSRFFTGYLEMSEAHYDIFVSTSERGRSVTISGLFNLLISADGKKNENYRDFGPGKTNSDNVRWFQKQVTDIIKREVVMKFDKNGTCEVSDDL